VIDEKIRDLYGGLDVFWHIRFSGLVADKVDSGIPTLGSEWVGFKFPPGSSVRPRSQSPKRTVPLGISVPDYAKTGIPRFKRTRSDQIEVSFGRRLPIFKLPVWFH
jgi:hypothetical protein